MTHEPGANFDSNNWNEDPRGVDGKYDGVQRTGSALGQNHGHGQG